MTKKEAVNQIEELIKESEGFVRDRGHNVDDIYSADGTEDENSFFDVGYVCGLQRGIEIIKKLSK